MDTMSWRMVSGFVALAFWLVPFTLQAGESTPSSGAQDAVSGAERPPQRKSRGEGRKGGSPVQSYVFNTEVPPHLFDVILCRPTPKSVTLSVLAYRDLNGHIRYGESPEALNLKTGNQLYAAGRPANTVLTELRSDSTYYYQFEGSAGTDSAPVIGPVSSFHTWRAPGTPFSFTVQADSHLDGATNPAVYEATLRNALAERPDFHIDLGDTFMTEKHASRDDASAQYLAQRYYFGLLCPSAPLFLVLGNHDGEQRRYGAGPDSLAAWANAMRQQYFPNPVPDGFYSGNSINEEGLGLLENYYAWTWGDALFVALDPFWHSTGRGNSSAWDRSLGEIQYRWLADTLASSRARYKFVFTHHLVGGNDKNARGGAEASRLFEWGGQEPDGVYAFDAHRPGWPAPTHALLVRYGVSVVFHGHDHFFMKQERDGVVYQLVPQPGHKGAGSARNAAEYGYSEGDIVSGSGHLRIQVDAAGATVSFIRTSIPGAGGAVAAPETAYTYTVPPK